MTQRLIFILIVGFLIGCKSLNKPPTQESLTNDSIEKYKYDLDSNEIQSEEYPINNLMISEDSTIHPSLDNQKLLVDYKKIIYELEKVRSDVSKVDLYAKISKTDSLIKVINNDSWPEDTETSYNLLRDNKGIIVYFAEYPMSESGDWSIGYRYYFNNKGNTTIFLRESNFFNSECIDGVSKELSSYYFDSGFKLISKEYELKSSDGKDLLNQGCYFPYHYEYNIERNLKDLVTKLKMKIQ